MKSVDAVPCRLEKLVVNAGIHIEFYVKLHAMHFLLMFIYCKNYSLEIHYSYIKIGSYFSITLYLYIFMPVSMNVYTRTLAHIYLFD